LTSPAPATRPAAAAIIALALLSSCASRPAAPIAPRGRAAPARAESPARGGRDASSRAAADRGRPSPGTPGLDYLDASLADYARESLPCGAALAVKRQAGRKGAAAWLLLARDGREAASEAGYDALAMAAAGRAAARPGAAVELRLDDDEVALELLCPAEAMAENLGLVARALSSPGFSGEDFDLSLREARIAERREAGDPLLRAAAELRASLYRDPSSGLPPRGTAASLAAATKESVMRHWSERFDAGRLSIAVVGDFEPRGLARGLERELEGAFGGLARGRSVRAPGGGPPAEGAPAIRPSFRALALSGMPGQALLRGEYAAPEPSSPDYPAMAVALSMLDDLLSENLRLGRGPARGAAWTRLSAGAVPSASVIVHRTGDPAAAKEAVDRAIADLARGLCIDASSASGALAPVARGLEAYKLRAIASTYARSASSEGMAARIASDLASGGDGTALFRMAARIGEVRAEDVVRVARQRLLEGPSAWVALGDPELVLALSPAAFALAPH
jgi:predicted Zn-dependent peptidase